MLRVVQKDAEGKEHTLPGFYTNGDATVGDLMAIEEKLNKVAAYGVKFSLVSWWDKEEKVDG
jgi:hypothetical protein